MVKQMIDQIVAETRKPRFNIIVDSINVDREMRRQFIDLFKGSNSHINCIWFKYSKPFTLHLNHQRLFHQEIQAISLG